jgi:hypothetical protein
VITEVPADRVRFEDGRPAALDGERLGLPTQIIRTPAGGVWAVYGVGEQAVVVHPGGAMRGPTDEVGQRLAAVVADRGRSDADRDAAATLLELVAGADDPGSAAVPQPYGERADVPRSVADTGLPPTYPISGPYNRPGEPDPDPEPPPPRERP